MCGAYLFLPEGRSRDINCEKPLVKIIEGKLISSVIVYCDFVVHAVNVYNCSGNINRIYYSHNSLFIIIKLFIFIFIYLNLQFLFRFRRT